MRVDREERIEALRLANNANEPPKQVVERAQAYLAFLTSDSGEAPRSGHEVASPEPSPEPTAETAAITGQSFQMVEYYARQVDQRKLGSAAILKLENRRGTGKASGKTAQKPRNSAGSD